MQYQQFQPSTGTGGEGLYVFGSISAKEKRRNRVPSAPESGFPPVLSHKYGVHHYGVLGLLGDGYRHMRPQLLLSWCHPPSATGMGPRLHGSSTSMTQGLAPDLLVAGTGSLMMEWMRVAVHKLPVDVRRVHVHGHGWCATEEIDNKVS